MSVKFVDCWYSYLVGCSFAAWLGLVADATAENLADNRSPEVVSIDFATDPVEMVFQSVDDSYHQGDPMIALDREHDIIDILEQRFAADSGNVAVRAKLAQAHVRLADAIGPYAMLGDPRLQKLMVKEFDTISTLLKPYLHTGNDDPYLKYFLARYFNRKASHWFLSGNSTKAVTPFLQGTLFYHSLVKALPEDPTWHRAVGLSYLAIQDSYPQMDDDFYKLVRMVGIGDEVLKQYPEADRTEVEKALLTELAVDSLEKTNELAPISIQLPCELSVARKRAAANLERLGFFDYADRHAKQINNLFCKEMSREAELIAANEAVNQIIDALKLTHVIPSEQLQAFQALARRQVDRMNLDLASEHYLAFWYGTLGYLAELEPINFNGVLPADLRDWGRKAIKGALSIEPDNNMLQRYLALANRVTEAPNNNLQGDSADAKATINRDSNMGTTSTSYDWLQLQQKGIGLLYESTIEEILNFYSGV